MENNELWELLNDVEKSNYLEFHELSYKDDLRHSEEVTLKFPRWSIISGYYAMHDITKLFLARQFSIKIVSPKIHAKTIAAVEYFIADSAIKQKVLPLLKKAQQTFYNVERLREKLIPVLLRKGKQEREQSQYYAEDYSEKRAVSPQKAVAFFEEIVKPYVRLIEGLL